MENEINKKLRKIIHIDMDAFYASVEQRDNPEYRDKPIIVGGSPEMRGVVATASYEARKYGLHSAMPTSKAFKLCPQVVLVHPRFDVYEQVSASIREIFSRYSDFIEPLSLDEAYLDVTQDKKNIGSAIEIAKLIKHDIKEELHLTASAGISINKFVAKIASDLNKPDGLTFIGPSKIKSFIEKLPIEKFYGVGKVTATKMRQMGINNGADLKKLSEQELIKAFGKAGIFYYNIARGIDNREVETSREIKSIGTEDTFPHDITDITEMCRELDKIAGIVFERLQQNGCKGRTITVKIKYGDFRIITRSRSFSNAIEDIETIKNMAKELLKLTKPENVKIRLLGISLSNFKITQLNERDTKQLNLFRFDE